MPPEYPTETHDKKSKKKVVLLLMAFTILVSGTTAFGLLYYKTKMNSDEEIASKQKTINKLEGRNANYLKQIDALKKTDDADTAEINNQNTHRQIPEFGVSYKLNDQNGNLTYTYGSNGVIGFSNVEIVNADQDKVCLGKAPLGSFIKVNANETFNNRPASEAAQALTANEETKNNVKKVGDFYIFYQSAQSSCAGNNTQLNELITPAAKSVVVQAMQSLEISE